MAPTQYQEEASVLLFHQWTGHLVKVNTETVQLIILINQVDLKEIYRIVYSNTNEENKHSYPWGVLQNRQCTATL